MNTADDARTYREFLETLSKDQLVELATLSRQAVYEAMWRYQKMRRACKADDPELIVAVLDSMHEGKPFVEYPKELDYMHWLITTKWT